MYACGVLYKRSKAEILDIQPLCIPQSTSLKYTLSGPYHISVCGTMLCTNWLLLINSNQKQGLDISFIKWPRVLQVGIYKESRTVRFHGYSATILIQCYAGNKNGESWRLKKDQFCMSKFGYNNWCVISNEAGITIHIWFNRIYNFYTRLRWYIYLPGWMLHLFPLSAENHNSHHSLWLQKLTVVIWASIIGPQQVKELGALQSSDNHPLRRYYRLHFMTYFIVC